MLKITLSVLVFYCALVLAQDAATLSSTAPQLIVPSMPSSTGITPSSTPSPLSNSTKSGVTQESFTQTTESIVPSTASSTTSIAPNTTKTPASTTSIAPNTTKTPASTTSIEPNTTKAPTSTTSIAPNTTEVPTPTSTAPSNTTSTTPSSEPTTTALPPPKKGHFVVLDGNKTCIIAEFAAQVSLMMNNQTSPFDVPSNLTYGGKCNNETQEIILSWQDDSAKNWSLAMQFKMNNTKFMVSSIILSVPQGNTTLNLSDNEPMFSTSVKKSYKCDKEQEIKLVEEETNTTYAVLKISHVQLEAFHESGGEKFSTAEDCAASSSPDIVPIAVGCALVGLIAIVLIAFLVGRRRSQARGYLSM